MSALHRVPPALRGIRSFTTQRRAPSSLPRFSPPSLTIKLSSPLRRPFSSTAPRPNNWRDPRHQHQHHDPADQLRRAKPLFTPAGLSRFIRSPSLHTVIVLSFGSAVAFYFWNLETVPVSGRRRFNCYSEAKVNATGAAQAKRIEYEVERAGRRFLSDLDPRTRLVQRVMRRLIPVSGMDGIEGTEWEVRVIDEPRVANAFVLPGGKVYVYSGLIPVARDESGLAAVLGHEIAHNLAEHVAERMSSQLGANILLYSLITLTGGIGILVSTYLGNAVLDLVFSRPMGRRQEAEADYIGLMMMAEACYDPRAALGFWERMRKMQLEEPPEWMSTHPSVRIYVLFFLAHI